MTSHFVLLSLSLVACGGVVADSTSTPSDPGNTTSTDGGPTTERTPDPAPDAAITIPTSTAVWARAEAAGFDPRACSPAAVQSDFVSLSGYVYAQLKSNGLTAAAINAGAGQCQFGSPPTTLSETEVFTGTPAQVRALLDAPPAAFHGSYIDAPIVVKEITSAKFEFYLGSVPHAFNSVWVHDGLDFAGELSFMEDICVKPSAFDAAIAMAPARADVEAWLAALEPGATYELGYDATLTFADGSTLEIPNGNQAVGSPYMGWCPNPRAKTP